MLTVVVVIVVSVAVALMLRVNFLDSRQFLIPQFAAIAVLIQRFVLFHVSTRSELQELSSRLTVRAPL